MGIGSRVIAGQSRTVLVTDTGVAVADLRPGETLGIILWPVGTSGRLYKDIEVQVVGNSVFMRTGPTGLVIANVLRDSDDRKNHDRKILNLDILPDLQREQTTHTLIGLRCNLGQSAEVTINPGVVT